jgi:hypothetical protein
VNLPKRGGRVYTRSYAESHYGNPTQAISLTLKGAAEEHAAIFPSAGSWRCGVCIAGRAAEAASARVGVRAKFTRLEKSMFEELEEEEKEKKESRKKRIWISAVIIAALVVIGTLVYVVSRPRAGTGVRTPSPTPAAQAGPPDALRDLQVVRAAMGKDVTGTRVLWSVQLRNKSAVYTYSDIQYEATFHRVDGSVLAVNRDTMQGSIGPGEEKRMPEFMDGIYDAAASTFQFVLTGAKGAAQ